MVLLGKVVKAASNLDASVALMRDIVRSMLGTSIIVPCTRRQHKKDILNISRNIRKRQATTRQVGNFLTRTSLNQIDFSHSPFWIYT